MKNFILFLAFFLFYFTGVAQQSEKLYVLRNLKQYDEKTVHKYRNRSEKLAEYTGEIDNENKLIKQCSDYIQQALATFWHQDSESIEVNNWDESHEKILKPGYAFRFGKVSEMINYNSLPGSPIRNASVSSTNFYALIITERKGNSKAKDILVFILGPKPDQLGMIHAVNCVKTYLTKKNRANFKARVIGAGPNLPYFYNYAPGEHNIDIMKKKTLLFDSAYINKYCSEEDVRAAYPYSVKFASAEEIIEKVQAGDNRFLYLQPYFYEMELRAFPFAYCMLLLETEGGQLLSYDSGDAWSILDTKVELKKIALRKIVKKAD